MKITLILAASPSDPLRKNDPFMPLSLPLIAASAPGHGYQFVDMLAGESPDYDAAVDLVGISYRVTAEKTAFEIAGRYRERNVKVVLGGPQASATPFRAIKIADAVVIGEGEGLWPIIVNDIEAGKRLKHFYVASPRRFDGGDYTIYQADDLLDLADVPTCVPERGLYRRKYVFDTVFSARGCAVDCDFCSVSRLHGRRTRLRPIGDVVREIESFRDFYYLLDDTVFGRPYTYDHYLSLYEAVGRLDKRRLWTGQANLDAAATEKGRAVIRAAAKAGLVYASVGMESVNPAVLEKTGVIKKMGVNDPEQAVSGMKERIRFIQDQGIAVSGWFTLGYEEDTINSFDEVARFCEETEILPVLCPLEALPGTRLHERLEQEGRIDNDRPINIVHPALTSEEILGAIGEITRKGYSFGSNLRRTRFYSKKFRKSDHVGKPAAKDVIKKTMFVHILQNKMKKGVVGLANAG